MWQYFIEINQNSKLFAYFFLNLKTKFCKMRGVWRNSTANALVLRKQYSWVLVFVWYAGYSHNWTRTFCRCLAVLCVFIHFYAGLLKRYITPLKTHPCFCHYLLLGFLLYGIESYTNGEHLVSYCAPAIFRRIAPKLWRKLTKNRIMFLCFYTLLCVSI